jgi:putative phosphoribosyl transferase
VKRFHDRTQAGRFLAEKLSGYAQRADVLVLALPRGGVPVGYEVARTLHVPLDVFLVRKLGVPGQEELAMGAIASGGIRIVNEDVVSAFAIPQEALDSVAAEEERELERREEAYRAGQPPPEVRGRTVILVDDGLATGTTMRAAIAALRRLEPARIVVAVPLGAPATCAVFQKLADEVICPMTPDPLYAVGVWYEDFAQTTDDQVRELLRRANEEYERPATKPSSELPIGSKPVPREPD